ncbi:hypothetical protein L873DRAFT_1807346 [Choiromyces venosus 120613-1]|uniref:Uncharacterized protein n=1 Tax=Choiromyces venosus 120613-1 TaxID=1336337 RepID=A0A3N4JPZ5_9PEZI|nr:hypothetical protein L873DRAFT_1807346 [Choiromyces venosus 120613-1]
MLTKRDLTFPSSDTTRAQEQQEQQEQEQQEQEQQRVSVTARVRKQHKLHPQTHGRQIHSQKPAPPLQH